MSDLLIPAGSLPPNSANLRYKDMGDGTFALVVSTTAGGGAVTPSEDTSQITVITLLNAVTTVSVGASVPSVSGLKTFQASGNTQSGVGAATIKVRGSLDGTHWDELGTITLTLDTLAVSDSFASNDRYAFLRGDVISISGTGATVTLQMGA